MDELITSLLNLVFDKISDKTKVPSAVLKLNRWCMVHNIFESLDCAVSPNVNCDNELPHQIPT